MLAQDLETFWDAMGNLTRRHDRGGMRDQDERFFYDSRDRLTRTDRRFNGGTWQVNQRQRYDNSGNILCKSDVSASSCTGSATNYSYGAGSAGPHAVTQAGPRTFVYDANGNVSSDRNSGVLDRTFAYTSYDKVRKISRGNRHIEFHYGADRARTLKIERTGTTVTERKTLGSGLYICIKAESTG